MNLLERVFGALERVDATVSRVRSLVKGGGASTSAEAEAIAPEPAKPTSETLRPLGDPSIAVQVYGRPTDPWTGRTTLLLRDRQIPFAFVDLDAKDNERLAPRLETETRQQITPYVYVRGEFIGGYNALDELDRLGLLEDRIKTEAERAREPDRGIRIEVPKRGAEERPPGDH